MNRRYAFHPKDFALGETEKFYGNMASKGWQLEKRGAFLSRFSKSAPIAARYRVEIRSPKLLEDYTLPQEQVELYRECGWEYVTGHGAVHVFRAPEGSDAPEFYMDPAQQAQTYRALRQEYLMNLLLLPIIVVAVLALAAALDSHNRGIMGILGTFGAICYHNAVEHSALVFGLCAVLVWGLFDSAWGLWHLRRLCSQMKRGISLDHGPTKHYILPQILSRCLLAAALVFGLLALAQWAGIKQGPLPTVPEAPYLANAGDSGEGTLSYSRSLLAECWQAEGQTALDAEKYDVSQRVYRLNNPALAETLAYALQADPELTASIGNFHPVDIPGLDGAWIAGRECIALRGDLVCDILLWHSFDSEADAQQARLHLLEILAAHWNHPNT